MLRAFKGTLVVVTHDLELLSLFDAIWHIKEQVRAKKSRTGGEKKIENRKWPTISSAAKMGRANETSNRKKSEIINKKQVLLEQISGFRLPEVLKPTFSIQASESG